MLTLEKRRYVSRMSGFIGQVSASEGCGRSGKDEGGLAFKARDLKTVLSS
jgi:hypothetical protein